ncbi:MAG: biotin--[acetyl-CoA-carboxylase] ligase [Bacteroidales bacterium]|jgi:BirA family biotin operon repressor/biotin-[acetyl-CoA-carboxylase] ligase|nr:biotin--[acetyl-CoA-carboxylase] ligase [Bacteroidales bacterium]
MHTPVSNQIIRLGQTESTNRQLLQLSSQESLEEGAVLVADFQTHGRGQGSNVWESDSGKNLTFSILFYPVFLRASEQFIISKAVSLAMCDFISRFVAGVSVKWPNDVYVGKQKITGILIENTVEGQYLKKTIAGIGVNINQERFFSNAPNPVSLFQLTGKHFNLEECLTEVLQAINARYKQIVEGYAATLHDDYLRHLYRLGEWAPFSAAGETFEARITGVNSVGMLEMITRDNQLRTFGFKEVEFVK